MIARGYLIIRRCGLMTSYIPTDKYLATMSPTKKDTITLYSAMGTFDLDPEEVHYLCGECGYNLYPGCACLPDPIVCPNNDVVVHRILLLNPPNTNETPCDPR